MAAANPLTSVSYKSFRPEAGAGSASTIRVVSLSGIVKPSSVFRRCRG